MGNTAPSRNAETGGIRVARVAGMIAARKGAIVPTRSGTMTVRGSTRSDAVGSPMPPLSNAHLSPMASSTPNAMPMSDATTPRISASMMTDRRSCARLAPMVRNNQASLGTAFTVSIEARHGVTTGISARDRFTTILAAIADDAKPDDVVSPGHVFPLRARAGGVLVRTGQTEGSVDLARLAGLKPAGVICEIMRDDGEMARRPELEVFGAKHNIMILSVADMIAYRLERERIVRDGL